MDRWHAECVPCRWQETFDTQDSAIDAAENHVMDEHRDLFTLPGDQRSRKMIEERIGHVQLRDTNAIGTGVSTGVTEPVQVTVEKSLDEQIAEARQNIRDALGKLDALEDLQRLKQAGGG